MIVVPLRVDKSLQDETAVRISKMFQSSEHIVWGYTKRTPTGLEIGIKVDEDNISLPDVYQMIADCNPLAK